MNVTAQIMSDLRSSNRAAIEAYNAKVADIDSDPDATDRIRYRKAAGLGFTERTTAKLTQSQQVAKQVLLQGTETWSMNNAKRDHSLPKRALSMASSRGRVTPEMLSSLMAFFASPSGMAETMLCSFLPTKVSTEQAKNLFSDPFVVDVIEGLGHKVPTPAQAVKLVRNPCNSRAGGARRVTIYSPGVAATVDAKRRGRPSGPKYVEYLRPTSDAIEAASLILTGPRAIHTCERTDGVPSPEGGAMADDGFTQGIGWAEAWDAGRLLTPAQIARRSVALDAASHGFRTDADGTVVERW